MSPVTKASIASRWAVAVSACCRRCSVFRYIAPVASRATPRTAVRPAPGLQPRLQRLFPGLAAGRAARLQPAQAGGQAARVQAALLRVDRRGQGDVLA